MGTQEQRVGGFAAYNTGRIENCYSCVPISSKGTAGGFCAENKGTLHNCFSRGTVSRRDGGRCSGFCASQDGQVQGCFWIMAEADKADKDKWTDSSYAVTEPELAEQSSVWLNGWDLETVWYGEPTEDKLTLFLLNQSPAFADQERLVEIATRDQLLEAVRAINAGETGRETMYRLTRDLDLAGMDWTPMGDDANTPFQGLFDGGGHTIENFVVRSKNHAQAGLFGTIGKHGQVCNLTVDCQLLGRGDHSAGMCGTNEGTVENCVVRMAGNQSRYAAGFAAQNSGRISRCCVFGSLRRALPFPWWLPALLLALLLCIPPMTFFAMADTGRAAEAFAPIIMDPNAKPIVQEEEAAMPEPEDLTDTSASFIMNAEMTVSTQNYVGALGLRCPPWSARGFVATASVDGTEIYKSGLIAPGMGVDVVTLSGNLPAGYYDVTVQFDFYDMETNEKAAVNSTAPLELTVQ